MEEKVRRAIKIAGVTAGVYLVFKYILPLAAPFVLAAAAAALLKPSAEAAAGKLQLRLGKRKLGVPPCVVGTAELCVVFGVIGAALFIGGRRLCQQAVLLMEQMPQWLERLNRWLTGICHLIEKRFTLRQDAMVYVAQDMVQGLAEKMKQGVMPYLMGNSVTLAQSFIGWAIIMILFVIGVMLFIREMDGIRTRMENSVFASEFMRIGRVLGVVGKAYLRAQGIILALVMAICVGVLFLLKNPYYILAGIGLGLLDALPFLGVGTVALPWAVICFFQKKWQRGLILLALYVVCYLLREFLEAKLLGDKVGLSSLETLVSIYVGLQLFGLFGVFLGPVGTLLIKEFAAKEPPGPREDAAFQPDGKK